MTLKIMMRLWQVNARVFVVSKNMSEITTSLRSKTSPFEYNFHNSVHNSSGLYSFWLRGKCIYVGMSMNLQKRIEQHSHDETNVKLKKYFEIYPNEIRISFVYLPYTEARIRNIESIIISSFYPDANTQGI